MTFTEQVQRSQAERVIDDPVAAQRARDVARRLDILAADARKGYDSRAQQRARRRAG